MHDLPPTTANHEWVPPFFLGSCEPEEADIALFGVCWDGTSSFKAGSRFAGFAVREASFGMEEFSFYQQATLLDIKYTDYGDLFLPPGQPPVRTFDGPATVRADAPAGQYALSQTVGAAVTVEIAGGTQALARAERLPVLHAGRRALVPRPNLLGAIVIKAAAVNNDRQPQRHLTDLAFLVSMVGDPLALRGELTAKDLARLRAVVPLQDPGHEAWRALGDPSEAFAAFQLLTRR